MQCLNLPLLSIIVPSYNHARFLAERFRSIYAQDFQDFELIVFDDASTDGSADLIQKLLKDNSYVLSVNATNSGSPFRQWEAGLSIAKGKYIWIAESDDSCDSSFVSSLLQCLESERAAIAFSRTQTIDERGNKLEIPYWPAAVDQAFFREHQTIPCSHFLRSYMSARNCIPNASSVIFSAQGFRRQVISASRRVASYQFVGDWIFWSYLLKAYGSERVVYDPRPLCFHRDHVGSTRAPMPRSKEKKRIEEYSNAVNQILLIQGADALLPSLSVIRSDCWAWSYCEYFWRYKPTKLEALFGAPQTGLHRFVYLIHIVRKKASNFRRLIRLAFLKLRNFFA
jgi:glycosyltransferase involved in cell wall biosynthesis